MLILRKVSHKESRKDNHVLSVGILWNVKTNAVIFHACLMTINKVGPKIVKYMLKGSLNFFQVRVLLIIFFVYVN